MPCCHLYVNTYPINIFTHSFINVDILYIISYIESCEKWQLEREHRKFSLFNCPNFIKILFFISIAPINPSYHMTMTLFGVHPLNNPVLTMPNIFPLCYPSIHFTSGLILTCFISFLLWFKKLILFLFLQMLTDQLSVSLYFKFWPIEHFWVMSGVWWRIQLHRSASNAVVGSFTFIWRWAESLV